MTNEELFNIAWGGAVDCLLSEDLPKDKEGQTSEKAYLKYKKSCQKRFKLNLESYTDTRVREALEKALETARRRNDKKDSRGFLSMIDYLYGEIVTLTSPERKES